MKYFFRRVSLADVICSHTTTPDRNHHDAHSFERLYKPYQNKLMALREVPTVANNPRFDSPVCIVAI
jgi:hypothetical protein